MSQREKTLLLGGVALILCSLALSKWLEPTDSVSPPLHAGKSKNNPSFPQSEFKLNISEAKRTMTLKNPRNIFAPLKTPVVPKKIQAPSALPPPQASRPSPAELAARQAKEEMQQFKFLGYLTREGVQQGFLSKDDTVYIVKTGETLETGITIRSIDPTEVVLSRHVEQAGTTVEATLPLTQDTF